MCTQSDFFLFDLRICLRFIILPRLHPPNMFILCLIFSGTLCRVSHFGVGSISCGFLAVLTLTHTHYVLSRTGGVSMTKKDVGFWIAYSNYLPPIELGYNSSLWRYSHTLQFTVH
jgi:hypothetical protein